MANKILILIIGILLGIIIGGIVIWYFPGFNGKNIFIIKEQAESHQEEKRKESSGNDKKNSLSRMSNVEATKWKDVDKDSLTLENVDNEILAGANVQLANFKDTALLALVTDSDFYHSQKSEELIVVKKDELLFSKNIKLVDLDEKSDAQDHRKDSLVQLASGITEPSSYTFMIEFWKSPINYRGYKMGRNKLILFGMEATDNPNLYKVKDCLFLKNGNRFYKIDKNSEFQPLEIISDSNILNLLNQ